MKKTVVYAGFSTFIMIAFLLYIQNVVMAENEVGVEAEKSEEAIIKSRLNSPEECCLCGQGERGLILSEHTALDGVSFIEVNTMQLFVTEIDISKNYVQSGGHILISGNLKVTSIPNRRYCTAEFDVDDTGSLIDSEAVSKLYCDSCLEKVVKDNCSQYIIYDHITGDIYPIKKYYSSFLIRDFTVQQSLMRDTMRVGIFYTPEVYSWDE